MKGSLGRRSILPTEWTALAAAVGMALALQKISVGSDLGLIVRNSLFVTSAAFAEGIAGVLVLYAAFLWLRGPRGKRLAFARASLRTSRFSERTLWQDLFRMVLALWVVLLAHYLVKTSIHVFNPRVYDPWLWRSDRWLGFGHDPKLIVLSAISWPPLLHAFDVLYSLVYPLLFSLTPPLFALLAPTRRLRIAAMTGFCLLWVLGGLLYVAFPSWGPVYTQPSHYESTLQSMPVTVYVQQQLFLELKGELERPQGPRPIQYGGVAAFPSLHLAVITLFTLAAWKIFRPWFWGNLAVTVGMFFGSLLTGYHYLLDSLAGIVLGGTCFWIALAWTQWCLQSAPGENDAPESSGGPSGGPRPKDDNICHFGADTLGRSPVTTD